MASVECGGPMDIVIVLDGSNSIYPWEPMMDFLKKLIPSLDIGPQNTQVTHGRKYRDRELRMNLTGFICLFFYVTLQVSVIQYAVDAQFEFKLNDYKTKEAMVAAVAGISQKYGHLTNTFQAIQYARLVFTASYSLLM